MLVVRRWPAASSMLELLPWSCAIATAALLPMALAHDPGHWDWVARLLMAGIGVAIAPLGTWCIMEATIRLPLVVASVGFLAGPALGVIMATVFLHERLGLDLAVGAGLILLGAGLAAGGKG
jgi:drug/metabolite transporter (DMT)-like permease